MTDVYGIKLVPRVGEIPWSFIDAHVEDFASKLAGYLSLVGWRFNGASVGTDHVYIEVQKEGSITLGMVISICVAVAIVIWGIAFSIKWFKVGGTEVESEKIGAVSDLANALSQGAITQDEYIAGLDALNATDTGTGVVSGAISGAVVALAIVLLLSKR